MSFWPFLRSPFTDLTANVLNHQTHSRCGELELKMADCLEAYGAEQGLEKCEPIIRDFQECAGMDKQLRRFYRMRYERQRQYWAGEKSKEEMYAEPPKIDSY